MANPEENTIFIKIESDLGDVFGQSVGDENVDNNYYYCKNDEQESPLQDDEQVEGCGDGPNYRQQSQLACDICDQTFLTKVERNDHIEEHFKMIKCPSCLRICVGDRAYEYHTSTGRCKRMVDQTKFRCSLCNEKVFDSSEALNNHYTGDHSCIIDKDRLICAICNRSFAQLKYLKKHVRELHEKMTLFRCVECNKIFNRKANLVEHQLIHDGKYLAKCEICGKSYRTPSALRLHVRMHTGEKPYECDICMQKKYSYNTDLKRHKRTAHGILGNPFPCTICTKVYYEPKLLKNHMKKSHKIDTSVAENS